MPEDEAKPQSETVWSDLVKPPSRCPVHPFISRRTNRPPSSSAVGTTLRDIPERIDREEGGCFHFRGKKKAFPDCATKLIELGSVCEFLNQSESKARQAVFLRVLGGSDYRADAQNEFSERA